jgi:hypothetical protein
MNISLARRTWRAAALLAWMMTLANAPGSATHIGPRHNIDQRSGSSPPTHLYEAQGGSVVAYSLAADGLPMKATDWQLNGGRRDAYGIGFDGAGDLYVSDGLLNQVRVYAPGASGDDLPVRTIPLPGPGCTMAVNKAAYVFVTVLIGGFLCGSTVYVYAPVVGPLSEAWVPQPIHAITNTKYAFFFDLITDSQGRLYAAPASTDIYVYNDPVNEWQFPNEDLVKKPDDGQDIYPPIAIGKDDGDLYMQFAPFRPRGWGGGDHAKRSLTTDKPDVLSYTRECNGSGGFGIENGLAVDQNYLMFTCWSESGLFVYHNLPGHQEPVEVLPGGIGILLWP